MDNLSVHKANRSKDTMRQLGFRWIYNLPYEPDFNPIEFTFARVKHRFRCLRAQMITGVLQSSYEAIIDKAVKSVKKGDIVNSVDHV